MAIIKVRIKRKLSDFLAKGHAKYGPVAPRKDYKEDDDEGGAGTSDFTMEAHPLLSQTPTGAPSDLTNITTENSEAFEEAKDRVNELNPQLQAQPAMRRELGQSFNPTPQAY